MLVELKQESVTNGFGGHTWKSCKFNSQIQIYSLRTIHSPYENIIKDQKKKQKKRKKKKAQCLGQAHDIKVVAVLGHSSLSVTI